MLILIKAKVSSICKNSNSQILFIQKIIITNLNSPTCKCSKLIAKHWVKTWKWLTYNMQVKRTLKFNNFLNSWVLMIIRFLADLISSVSTISDAWCFNKKLLEGKPLPMRVETRLMCKILFMKNLKKDRRSGNVWSSSWFPFWMM